MAFSGLFVNLQLLRVVSLWEKLLMIFWRWNLIQATMGRAIRVDCRFISAVAVNLKIHWVCFGSHQGWTVFLFKVDVLHVDVVRARVHLSIHHEVAFWTVVEAAAIDFLVLQLGCVAISRKVVLVLHAGSYHYLRVDFFKEWFGNGQSRMAESVGQVLILP